MIFGTLFTLYIRSQYVKKFSNFDFYPSWIKISLNIIISHATVANKAFPKQQSILDYMKETLRCTEEDFRNGLRPQVKEKLQNFLKGLKIEYRMPSSNPDEINKRNYKIVGLGRDAENER